MPGDHGAISDFNLGAIQGDNAAISGSVRGRYWDNINYFWFWVAGGAKKILVPYLVLIHGRYREIRKLFLFRFATDTRVSWSISILGCYDAGRSWSYCMFQFTGDTVRSWNNFGFDSWPTLGCCETIFGFGLRAMPGGHGATLEFNLREIPKGHNTILVSIRDW